MYNTFMITRKSTFFLGIFIFIVPFLGVPSSWKTLFITLSGLTIIIMSVKISLPKKTTKTRIKREKVTPVFVQSTPIYPKDNNLDTEIKKE
jgi:hypothetical protein